MCQAIEFLSAGDGIGDVILAGYGGPDRRRRQVGCGLKGESGGIGRPCDNGVRSDDSDGECRGIEDAKDSAVAEFAAGARGTVECAAGIEQGTDGMRSIRIGAGWIICGTEVIDRGETGAVGLDLEKSTIPARTAS